jgi:hypothetical protein
MDCTKFSKTALKAFLSDPALKAHHAEIQAYLAPKPKDYTPVEGKIQTRLKSSTVSTTVYPKGYVRVELNQGNGILYKNATLELIAHLQGLVDSGKVRDRE